ncbi:MAG: PilN domain-containing protein [Chthoniobacteraceae bacterium]
MALHLNLYHEVQKQAALRRRDPLKLSLYGMGAVALAFAGYYFLQVGTYSSIASENRAAQSEYDTLKSKAELAQKRADEISAMLATSKKLTERIDGRLYWAPILEQLTSAVPAEIQLTRLAGDSSGESVKRSSLTVDGIAAGEEPRQVAEEFRRRVAERFGEKYQSASATFKSLEDSPETVRINGKITPTATFSINIQMQSGTSDNSAALQAAQPAATKAEA